MRNYTVRFSRVAIRDLDRSYDWGVENWGLDLAEIWLAEIQSTIENRLSSMPIACSVAPESDDFDFEVRQLILGRYRVIYKINDDDVLVLSIRGAYWKLRNRD